MSFFRQRKKLSQSIYSLLATCLGSLLISATAEDNNYVIDLYSLCATSAMVETNGQILDIAFESNDATTNQSSGESREYNICHVRIFNKGTVNTISFKVLNLDGSPSIALEPLIAEHPPSSANRSLQEIEKNRLNEANKNNHNFVTTETPSTPEAIETSQFKEMPESQTLTDADTDSTPHQAVFLETATITNNTSIVSPTRTSTLN